MLHIGSSHRVEQRVACPIDLTRTQHPSMLAAILSPLAYTAPALSKEPSLLVNKKHDSSDEVSV